MIRKEDSAVSGTGVEWGGKSCPLLPKEGKSDLHKGHQVLM